MDNINLGRLQPPKILNMRFNVERTLEQCKILGASYVQKIIDNFNNRFPNLPIFTLAKLFSPRNYTLDHHDRGQFAGIV